MQFVQPQLVSTALAMFTLLFPIGAIAQTKLPSMNQEKTTNPLLCSPDTGLCEIPGQTTETQTAHLQAAQKPVRIVYFTDPICSSCWGIEPQLRRLKLEYGEVIDIEYHMGGLLPSWDVYNSGGISKPSDVAHHWDEVSAHYEMPIDGDVWLEDPLPSSYPPSIAFKAAEMQNHEKALLFLRRIREMVFLEKKNITRWEHLETAAAEVGLDTFRFKTDYEGAAPLLFQNDLTLARQLGVRGFPTVFFANDEGNQAMVYGARPYSQFEQAVLKSFPEAKKNPYDMGWENLFGVYGTLTAKEFGVLSGREYRAAIGFLEQLVGEGKLKQFSTKNGGMWWR